jgi:hypothetical protein
MLMMKVWKGRSEKTRADHVDGRSVESRPPPIKTGMQPVTCRTFVPLFESEIQRRAQLCSLSHRVETSEARS